MSGEDKKRGGAREGAGRKSADPHLVRVPVPLRLPAWLVEWIDAQEGTRADLIEAGLMKAYRLKAPKAP